MSSIALGAIQTGRAARWRESVEAWLTVERHQLPLWIPVAFGAGVAAWFGLPWREQWQAAGLAFLAVSCAGLALGGLAGRALLIGGLLAASGLGVAWQRAESVVAPRLEREVRAVGFTGRVLETQLLLGRERYRLVIAPTDPALPLKIRVSLRAAPPAAATPGAIVSLKATLRPPLGPSVPRGYDFARRAWFEGLGASGFALSPVTVTRAAPPPSSFRASLDALRAKLTARMQVAVGGLSGGVAAALVTGDEGGIPDEINQAWRDSGIAHLLSISGLHIAVVAGGAMWLVRKTLLLWPWLALRLPVKTVAAGFAALSAIAYTLLAGAEVPTVRSCLATLVVLAGLALGRQAVSLRTVAVAAFVILALRPEALAGPSFQLSFAAVVAIVGFYESPFGRSLLTPGEFDGWAMRVGRAFAGLFVSGLLVEAALSPIALAHFGRAGAYGVLANLFAIPFSSFVVMPLTVLALVLDPLGFAGPVFAALRWSFDLLNTLAFAVAGLPGAVAHTPTWPPAAFAVMIAGGVWAALWRTRVRWLGIAPALAGLGWALATPPADLLVAPDGRHAALMVGGRLAMLRPLAGRFILDMMGDATAATRLVALDDVPEARCSPEACIAQVERGGRRWTILATRSRQLVDRQRFERACAAADIAISDRRLPDWCAPRWLKLDAPALANTGAVALDLSRPMIRTVAAEQGDHPWRALPSALPTLATTSRPRRAALSWDDP